jgi:chromosomal replication initiation ATPase DnaA
MNYNAERFVGYIVGASGSGKSYFIREWCKEYHKKFKKNPIYLFSALSEDDTLDTIKPQRIMLDDAFINDPVDLGMYENSLLIFDDCDSIANKKIKDKVYIYLNAALNLGRHFNISIWCVNHTPTGKRAESKTILNESHLVVFFPANFNRQLAYLLE